MTWGLLTSDIESKSTKISPFHPDCRKILRLWFDSQSLERDVKFSETDIGFMKLNLPKRLVQTPDHSVTLNCLEYVSKSIIFPPITDVRGSKYTQQERNPFYHTFTNMRDL